MHGKQLTHLFGQENDSGYKTKSISLALNFLLPASKIIMLVSNIHRYRRLIIDVCICIYIYIYIYLYIPVMIEIT